MVRKDAATKIVFSVLLLFYCQIQSTSAQSAPSPSPRSIEESKFVDDLRLTSTQVEKLTSLSKTLVRPTIPLAQDLEEARQKLEQLLASSSASVGDIRSQYRRVELIRQAIYRLDVEYRLGLRDILTPEQRAKYEEYIRERVEQTQIKR